MNRAIAVLIALVALGGLVFFASTTTTDRRLDVSDAMRDFLGRSVFVAKDGPGGAAPAPCDASGAWRLAFGLSDDESMGKSQMQVTAANGAGVSLGIIDAGGPEAGETVAILLLDAARNRFPVRLERLGDGTLAVRSPEMGVASGVYAACPRQAALSAGGWVRLSTSL